MTRGRTDLAETLARGLGPEAARLHVERVAEDLGLRATLTTAEALRVLEVLAAEPGALGIAARFAKARVHLNWGDD